MLQCGQNCPIQSKILSAVVPVKRLGRISVEGFVVSCVKSWFINCTGFISVGSSGNKMSKELSLESVWEVSNDCDRWSRSVRRSWAESTRESAGDCEWQLTVASNEVRCGNWTTVSPCCIDQGSVIPGWMSGKSGHSKDCTRRWCGGFLPESSADVVPPGGVITSLSGSLVRVNAVRVCL